VGKGGAEVEGGSHRATQVSRFGCLSGISSWAPIRFFHDQVCRTGLGPKFGPTVRRRGSESACVLRLIHWKHTHSYVKSSAVNRRVVGSSPT
jgi:hypothetical protein